jgi:hypothetical protein
MIAVASATKPADELWGFPFGVDGLVTLAEAQRRLAGCSADTIERLVAKGQLRKGKMPCGGRRVGICARSLQHYISSMEIA